MGSDGIFQDGQSMRFQFLEGSSFVTIHRYLKQQSRRPRNVTACVWLKADPPCQQDVRLLIQKDDPFRPVRSQCPTFWCLLIQGRPLTIYRGALSWKTLPLFAAPPKH